MPPAGGYAFGPFQLDIRAKRLLKSGISVPLTPQQFELLATLAGRAGEIISKDDLARIAWPDVIVSDASVEQAISRMRRLLDADNPNLYITNFARRGYQFAGQAVPLGGEVYEASINALLDPHRAMLDGTAALETLEREKIAQARATFEQLTARHRNNARFHVGLANACVLGFEATRAGSTPDVEALGLAEAHAREACHLDSSNAEAWATLGFILERTGARADALAALDRAVTLEPGNWRHEFRLAYGSWGERCLAATRRTLAHMPDLALARCLAARVYVARDARTMAEQELDAGLADMPAEPRGRFSAVAICWLKGLLCLARGAEDEAMEYFQRELASESSGHLYARECAAQGESAMTTSIP